MGELPSGQKSTPGTMTSQSYYFVGAVLTVLIFLVGYVVRVQNTVTAVETKHNTICEEHVKKLSGIDERLEELTGLTRAVDLLTERMELYMKVLDPHLAQVLHSPLHQIRDELVDRLVAGDLTPEAAQTLAVELKELLAAEDRADKKLAAALLLARVEWDLAKNRPEF